MKKINSEQLKQLIEATIFVSDQPVSVDKLKNTVLADFTVSDKAIQSALNALQLDYRPRGIQLVEVASGYRFQSLDSLSPWLSRLWQETSPKYSRAMLETLALIAYRQPITRGEIEQVRGVAVSSNIIKTLTEREWIKVIGHKEVPGRPALYATTKQFLDYFSLKSLSDLPNAEEFMASLDATQNVTHVLHDDTGSQAEGDSDNQKESIH
ncbi:MAG: SMC-Scp complex subunit ScpB [Pseudomonadota bacterium]|jgi:segregation and condensation protein B|uniref:SMC-Scp complex subunit ScpB n=2 Tax=Alteromonas TaxID=226 RepID=A0A2S9VB51_9ALTE|nr:MULTISPECIES: SMC-Scp complex subunit ScpB [Alteromonas]MCP4863580.1 SMC-Scp complex subunit ScpB [Alteromonas sp.]MDY6927392.1 SMC-Scp complex subunit ScpB [Pseudomonadota bacterium]PRO73688.1 SMC-Scp complex subunit ScpB [Alteromonas alba]RPH13063.1 MAG: SMC-Scp complex subunit ScpB [Alteromonadaceae bacterium TMED7]|tara:strand:+ start:65 stop:694 length:630 start_codon:yes stop_codon:yes gene_type:complete